MRQVWREGGARVTHCVEANSYRVELDELTEGWQPASRWVLQLSTAITIARAYLEDGK